MAGGVFYREFTKFYAYSMPTVLSVIHPHLLILGTLLFIILAVIAKVQIYKIIDYLKNL